MRVRSPLLAQSLLFSFPPGTEMFQFPGLTPLWEVSGSLPTGCPIRTSAGQWVFAPNRGFSQLVTSFVVSKSLGILHVPFSPFLVLSLDLRNLSTPPSVASSFELTFFFRSPDRSFLIYSFIFSVTSSEDFRLAVDVSFLPVCQCSLVWRITDSNR